MIVALFGAGALLAASGTRLLVVALVPAAVLAATEGGPTALAGTWTAALAAGLVLLGRPPRTTAIPLAGAGAALLAGAATNAALVLPAWTLATAAVAVTAGSTRPGRRWAIGLAVADLPVVAAVVWTVWRGGFVPWPALDVVGASLLLAGALVRVPLAAGPEDRAGEPGLLAVRAQTVVLMAVALEGLGPHAGVGTAVLLGGLALALAASFAGREGLTDILLELGLVAAALGAGRLGWTPAGWAWGALAAGTLNHWLRVRVGAPGGRWAWSEALVARGGGLGSPFLPVGAAIAIGGVARGGALGGAAVVGVVGALAGRVATTRRRPGGGRLRPERAIALASAVLAGLWAPLLALPRPPGGEAIAWPPTWVFVLVILGAGLGLSRPETLGPRRSPGPPMRLPSPVVRARWLEAPVRARGALGAPLIVIAMAAVAVWTVGLARGFL